jgi:hypothetical protein
LYFQILLFSQQHAIQDITHFSILCNSPLLLRRLMNSQRVAKSGQLGRGWFCHTLAMTTKTIPEYLEGERQKGRDIQLRVEEEAARIQLHHGHYRTAKQPKLELPSAVAGAPKARKTVAASRKKPRTARKTATKFRKVA